EFQLGRVSRRSTLAVSKEQSDRSVGDLAVFGRFPLPITLELFIAERDVSQFCDLCALERAIRQRNVRDLDAESVGRLERGIRRVGIEKEILVCSHMP